MKNLSKIDNNFIRLIRSALTAIDGLWFLEVEKKHGFKEAFDMDLQVWKRYGPIIIKRIKKIIGITDDSLDSFLKILEILCAIDGTEFRLKKKSANKVTLEIVYCPWWENLKHSQRENLVRCDIVDETIFPEWANSFNPKLEFKLIHSIPNGNKSCEWVISLKD